MPNADGNHLTQIVAITFQFPLTGLEFILFNTSG